MKYDGTRYERVTWFDPVPAGGNLLCVRGRRGSGGASFQLRSVWVGDQLSTRVKAPIPLKSPDIYRPLFWGGLWGIPFGLLIGAAWKSLYLFGFLYVLAPLLALFLIFLPLGGAGLFGLRQGPMFTLYLLLVNLPFGIITALVARAIIGTHL